MKRIIGIFLGLFILCCSNLQLESQIFGTSFSENYKLVLDEPKTSVADVNEIGSRRARSTTQFLSKPKPSQISTWLELSGFQFFSCKISLSYIPVYCAEALQLRFGHTIHVNAP